MATRANYRQDLKDKLLGLEDSGYGDFDYADTELDTFLEMAVARLFPAIFKRVEQTAVTLTQYGSNLMGFVTPVAPERVYLIEDSTELEAIVGWRVSGARIVGLRTDLYSTCNLHYTDAYTLPNDDVTDAAIAEVYRPLIVLGALIEALEARQDTGVRGDPPPTGNYSQTQLLDRLTPRYERLKEDLAMSLPAVSV